MGGKKMVNLKKMLSGILAASMAASIMAFGALSASAADWTDSVMHFEADEETVSDPWNAEVTKVDGFGGKPSGNKSLAVTGDFSDKSHGFMLASNQLMETSSWYYVDFMFLATGDYDSVRIELKNSRSTDPENVKAKQGDGFTSFKKDGTVSYSGKAGTWQPGIWHRVTVGYNVQSSGTPYMYLWLDGTQVMSKTYTFGGSSAGDFRNIDWLRLSVYDETPDEGVKPTLYLDDLSLAKSNRPNPAAAAYTLNRSGGIYTDGSKLYASEGETVGTILSAFTVTGGTAVLFDSELNAKQNDEIFESGDTVTISNTDGTNIKYLELCTDSIVAGQSFDDSTGTIPGANLADAKNNNTTVSYASEAISGRKTQGMALVNTFSGITSETDTSGFFNIVQASSGAQLLAKNGSANILPEALTFEYSFLATGDYNYTDIAGRWDFYDTSAGAEVTKRSQIFLRFYKDGSVTFGNALNPIEEVSVLPNEWVNVQLTFYPYLNAFSAVLNGKRIVNRFEITAHMDKNEDIPYGFGWFGPGMGFAAGSENAEASLYIGEWSARIGEYTEEGYEASAAGGDLSENNKIVYIPDRMKKADFISMLAAPGTAEVRVFADRTFETEVAAAATVSEGNVVVITSANGKAVNYYDVAIGGLGTDGGIVINDNGDGTVTAELFAWYELKNGETEQPYGRLIIAVYNPDGSLAGLKTDYKVIASGDGTEFSASASVSEGQSVKAMFMNAAFKPYIPAV